MCCAHELRRRPPTDASRAGRNRAARHRPSHASSKLTPTRSTSRFLDRLRRSKTDGSCRLHGHQTIRRDAQGRLEPRLPDAPLGDILGIVKTDAEAVDPTLFSTASGGRFSSPADDSYRAGFLPPPRLPGFPTQPPGLVPPSPRVFLFQTNARQAPRFAWRGAVIPARSSAARLTHPHLTSRTSTTAIAARARGSRASLASARRAARGTRISMPPPGRRALKPMDENTQSGLDARAAKALDGLSLTPRPKPTVQQEVSQDPFTDRALSRAQRRRARDAESPTRLTHAAARGGAPRSPDGQEIRDDYARIRWPAGRQTVEDRVRRHRIYYGRAAEVSDYDVSDECSRPDAAMDAAGTVHDPASRPAAAADVHAGTVSYPAPWRPDAAVAGPDHTHAGGTAVDGEPGATAVTGKLLTVTSIRPVISTNFTSNHPSGRRARAA